MLLAADSPTNELLTYGSPDMATQPERIAALEASLGHIKWMVGILIPCLIGWGAYVTINVVAMKQSLADGGSAKLVTELKQPRSPEQLRAGLSTVIAAVQTAQANGTKPDQKKTKVLSEAVLHVVKAEPQLPEAWRAAAVLVNYRSPQSDSLTKNCFDTSNSEMLGNITNDGRHVPDVLGYKDCVLDLGAINDFENSDAGLDWSKYKEGSQSGLIFQLRNVHLVYHGGQTIPFVRIDCTSCSFDFRIEAPPPQAGRDLMQALLGADDLAKIAVDSPRGI